MLSLGKLRQYIYIQLRCLILSEKFSLWCTVRCFNWVSSRW